MRFSWRNGPRDTSGLHWHLKPRHVLSFFCSIYQFLAVAKSKPHYAGALHDQAENAKQNQVISSKSKQYVLAGSNYFVARVGTVLNTDVGVTKMRTSIKIIKPDRPEARNELRTAQPEKSVEQSTREIVGTIKSWIAELQERKRAQRHSFALLPVTATDQPNGKS